MANWSVKRSRDDDQFAIVESTFGIVCVVRRVKVQA